MGNIWGKKREEVRRCRICYEDSDGLAMVHPCKCSGSIKWVHSDCLLEWLKQRPFNDCEICGQHFIISYRFIPLPLKYHLGQLYGLESSWQRIPFALRIFLIVLPITNFCYRRIIPEYLDQVFWTPNLVREISWEICCKIGAVLIYTLKHCWKNDPAVDRLSEEQFDMLTNIIYGLFFYFISKMGAIQPEVVNYDPDVPLVARFFGQI